MAIFSNDPNIGIRQMGLEGFIPTPVSSVTFKGNAGVNARRAANYQNAPLNRPKPTVSQKPRNLQQPPAPQKPATQELFARNPFMAALSSAAKPVTPADRRMDAVEATRARAAGQRSLARVADNIEDMGPPRPYQRPSDILSRSMRGELSMKPTEDSLMRARFAQEDEEARKQNEMYRAKYGPDWDMTPDQMRAKRQKLEEADRQATANMNRALARARDVSRTQSQRRLREAQMPQRDNSPVDPFSREAASAVGNAFMRGITEVPSYYLGPKNNQLTRAIRDAGSQLFNLPNSVNEALKRGMPVR